jgi:hypothetical protein
MIGLFSLFLALLTAPFKSKSRLEAENAALRHQLIVLRRKMKGRVRLTNNDRWFLIQLYRWFPSILNVLTIIRTETLMRWHRAGFRCYCVGSSRPLGGRTAHNGLVGDSATGVLPFRQGFIPQCYQCQYEARTCRNTR